MTMGGLRDAIFSDKAIWEVTRSGHGLKMLKRTVRIDRLNLGWFSQQNRWCLGSFTRENMDLTWIYCNYHSTPIISWNGSTLYTSPHWMKFRHRNDDFLWSLVALISSHHFFILTRVWSKDVESLFHQLISGPEFRCHSWFGIQSSKRAGWKLPPCQKRGVEKMSTNGKRGPRKIRLQDCIYPTTFKCLQIKKNQFFLVDLILAMALAKSGYVGLYRNYHPCGGTVCARPACFGTLIQRLLVSVRLGSLGCPKFFKEDVPSGKLT